MCCHAFATFYVGPDMYYSMRANLIRKQEKFLFDTFLPLIRNDNEVSRLVMVAVVYVYEGFLIICRLPAPGQPH